MWQVQAIEFTTKVLPKGSWKIAELATAFKYLLLTNCQNESRAWGGRGEREKEKDIKKMELIL